MDMRKWIVHGTTNENADINLLCFPHAGGSPSFYAPWKRMFRDTSTNLCPVLYPMRELRKEEPLPDSLEEMISAFLDESSDCFRGDYVLFGHCTGGLICYEVADQARKRFGREPLGMFISGCESPRYALAELTMNVDNKTGMSDQDLVDRLISFGIVEKDFAVTDNFASYYIPIYRADLTMLANYRDRDKPLFHCPIIVSYGMQDPTVQPEQVADWQNYTSGAFHSRVFSGQHFYLNDQKEEMVDFIKEEIKGMHIE